MPQQQQKMDTEPISLHISQLGHHISGAAVELILLRGADDSTVLRPLHQALQQAHVPTNVCDLEMIKSANGQQKERRFEQME